MAPRKLTEKVQKNYTIRLYKGITYNKSFVYKDSSGTPINLTGKSVSIKFKDIFPTQLELFSDGAPSDLGSTITITDATEGAFTIQITLAETLTGDTGQGRWWIELHDGTESFLIWLDDVTLEEI